MSSSEAAVTPTRLAPFVGVALAVVTIEGQGYAHGVIVVTVEITVVAVFFAISVQTALSLLSPQSSLNVTTSLPTVTAPKRCASVEPSTSVAVEWSS